MLATREAISVAILVIYIPALVASLYVGTRQGFARQSGFYYLTIFCGLRIAGAIMEIISQKNPTNVTDAAWAAILSSIGLSPLLLASTGLLKRVTALTSPRSVRVRALRLLAIPCLLALVLAIVGGTRLYSSDQSKRDNATKFLKAAGILFLVVLLGLIGAAGAVLPAWPRIPNGETQIYVAVLLALPFLTVRLVYTLLEDFAHTATFNILDPNAFVQLGMSIIMEMIVTIAYIIVGISAPSLQQQQQTQPQQQQASLELVNKPDQVNSGHAYAQQSYQGV